MSKALAFLALDWWKQSAGLAARQSSYFILPSLGLAFSNIVSVLADHMLPSFFEFDLSALPKLMMMLLALFILLLIGLAVGFWSLMAWCLKLTQIASVYISSGSDFSSDDFAVHKALAKTRLPYLKGVWFWGSLYMLIPLVAFSILLALQILTGPTYKINGHPFLEFPLLLQSFMWVAICLLFAVILAYSLMLIAVSAGFQFETSRKAASAILILCLQRGREVMALTLIVMMLNVLITAPQLFLFCFPATEVLRQELWFGIVCQLWFAFAASFVWTLSILPYAQFAKTIDVAARGATPAFRPQE